MSEQATLKSCSKQCYEVQSGNLPLSCPIPGMTKWNAHPRVYLDIEVTGKVLCPYCSTLYVLIESTD